MGEYARIFDMEPSEKTAEMIRYGGHKAKVQNLHREAYYLHTDGKKWYVDVGSIFGWGVFSDKEDAEAFIERRLTKSPGRKKLYSSLCRCGPTGWDYYYFDNGIVAELCNTCGNPIYQVCLDALNQQAIADVNLFDLLG